MNRATVALFHGPGRAFELAEVPLPTELAPGELLVKLHLATICGSDLHTWQGRREAPTPCVLGHEGIGTVIGVGAGRSEDWLGVRVSWTLSDHCGRCLACVDYDLPQKCERLSKYGHASMSSGSGLNGCYATHIILRGGTHVVPVPSTLPDTVVAPANCALATMIAATERLPHPCRTVVIQGAGLLGLYGARILRTLGVERVLLVEPHPERRRWIAPFGGTLLEESDLAAYHRQVDLVIEAAGTPAVVGEGFRMLRVGGEYVFVGMVHPESEFSLTGEAIIRSCLTLRGIHNYAPRHLDRAIEFLNQHAELPWASLISPPLDLSRIDEAFELAATRRWSRVAIATDIERKE